MPSPSRAGSLNISSDRAKTRAAITEKLSANTALSNPSAATNQDAPEIMMGSGPNKANPLVREISVNINTTMAKLCRGNNNEGSWCPDAETINSILQQTQFVSRDGTTERRGDVSSIILHEVTQTNAKTTFPVPLGLNISGVEPNRFSSKAKAFSAILPSNADLQNERVLQKDEVDMAYDFSNRHPGYTDKNLYDKGLYKIKDRNVVMVNQDHPLMECINENREKIQANLITETDDMLKISDELYNFLMPFVHTQVSEQINARDFSSMCVSIHPAEHASWDEARTSCINQLKIPILAQKETDLAAAVTDADTLAVKQKYTTLEMQTESQVDNQPVEVSISMRFTYNFMNSDKS